MRVVLIAHLLCRKAVAGRSLSLVAAPDASLRAFGLTPASCILRNRLSKDVFYLNASLRKICAIGDCFIASLCLWCLWFRTFILFTGNPPIAQSVPNIKTPQHPTHKAHIMSENNHPRPLPMEQGWARQGILWIFGRKEAFLPSILLLLPLLAKRKRETRCMYEICTLVPQQASRIWKHMEIDEALR